MPKKLTDLQLLSRSTLLEEAADHLELFTPLEAEDALERDFIVQLLRKQSQGWFNKTSDSVSDILRLDDTDNTGEGA